MRPCAELRQAFRDYSDGELTPEEKGEVDEHVHACEPCGRLLMQAELEVIRLKQAIQFVEPPPDFTRIAVQRAREELARDGLGASLVDAPEDFTANVMKQVLREAGRTPVPGTARPRRAGGVLHEAIGVEAEGELTVRRRPGRLVRFARHPAVLMPLAAAAALLLVWGLWLRTARPDGLRLEAGEATAVAPATDVAPAEVVLRLGHVLRAGHEVRVAEGRTAVLHGAGAFDGIRAVEVQGPARLVLAAALPRAADAPHLSLLEGSVRVSSSRAVWMTTPIPAELRLAPAATEGETVVPAEMDVSLREITRHDESLAGGRVFHALRVRVLSGEASVQRGDAPPERIAAAEVAVLDPWAPIRKERVLDTEWLASISLAGRGTVGGGRAAIREKGIQGTVVRTTDGMPLGAAIVTLHLGESRHEQPTLHDGSFQISAAGSQWEGVTPFLSVKAPAGSRASDLHHHPVPQPSAERILLIGNVGVPGSRSARGRVSTADDRAVPGARVRVFEHDALFGRSRELEALAVVTGPDGEFELLELPAASDQGVGIVLLLDHPDHPLTTRFDLLERRRARSWTSTSRPRPPWRSRPPSRLVRRSSSRTSPRGSRGPGPPASANASWRTAVSSGSRRGPRPCASSKSVAGA